MKIKKNNYLVSPDINNNSLTKYIKGVDQNNNQVNTKVIQEKALTIFLNNQEIVTLMSIGDHPKYLSVGYLLNQNMLKSTDRIKSIEYDDELSIIIVRTNRQTNYEKILKKKLQQADVLKEQFLVISMKRYKKQKSILV